MENIYCSATDVKRLLRVLSVSGKNQHKIKFSDSYTVPEAYSTNAGDCVLKGISSIAPSYAGSEQWHITFTSSTAFTLYRGADTTVVDGTGLTSASFVSTSGIITISSTEWVGTPVTGDQFKFKTDSNISSNDAIGFMEDASRIVDGTLGEFIDPDYLPFTSVPGLINRSAMYMSASIIFTSIFSMLSPDQIPALVRRWYAQGKNFVDLYLSSIPGKEKYRFSRYGRFVAHEPLFEKVGVKEAAGIEDLKGELETLNEPYDTGYNTEE
uniref:Uncharacterized protein n=1 Tax=viral metagenome TaxID=1070528 RepID=A0A6M3KSW3_9ZZZZ